MKLAEEITSEQLQEINIALLNAHLSELKQQYPGKWIGYLNGELLVAKTKKGLHKKVDKMFPNNDALILAENGPEINPNYRPMAFCYMKMN